jgi:hypothetical protein
VTASQPTPLLTQEEFQNLLQRAAERDVFREPRRFALGELVDAGREIGIDPITVQEVYGQYHRLLQRPRQVHQRPLDSELSFNCDGDFLQLIVPESPCIRGLQVGGPLAAVMGAVAASWAGVDSILCAIAAVTVSAWILVSEWATRIAGHELRLRRDGSGLLLTFKGRTTKSYILRAGQVHARLDAVPDSQHPSVTRRFVTLDHGTETHALLVGYSYGELAWAVETIERWLGR